MVAEPEIRASGDTPVTMHPCPGGPVLVRGRAEVLGDDGEWQETTRPVSAVCRCGASALRPWCDGTHKVLTRRGANPIDRAAG